MAPSQIYLINTIESVQKQFTKRFPGLKNLTYEERLKLLGLQSLEHRRLIFDLVLCYNIIHGHSAIPLDQMFSLNKNTTLRGHPLKITQPLPKNNTVKSFFAYRVIAPMELSKRQHCHGNQCQNVQKSVKSNRLKKISNLSFYIANIFTNYYSTPDKNQKFHSTHPLPSSFLRQNDFKLCNRTQLKFI